MKFSKKLVSQATIILQLIGGKAMEKNSTIVRTHPFVFPASSYGTLFATGFAILPCLYATSAIASAIGFWVGRSSTAM